MFESHCSEAFAKRLCRRLTKHHDVIETQTKNCMRNQIVHATPLRRPPGGDRSFAFFKNYFLEMIKAVTEGLITAS